MTHTHAPILTIRECCYSGTVNPHDENRAAHGWIEATVACHCGAQRRENQNGRHVEIGRWETAAEMRDRLAASALAAVGIVDVYTERQSDGSYLAIGRRLLGDEVVAGRGATAGASRVDADRRAPSLAHALGAQA